MPVQNAAAVLAGNSTVAAPSVVHAVAAVALATGATFGPPGAVQHKAVASVAGLATAGPTILARYKAAAPLVGLASVVGTPADHDKVFAHVTGLSSVSAGGVVVSHNTAPMMGVSVFFVDPSKVILIPFFKTVKPPAVTVVAPRQTILPTPPNNMTVGVRRAPPNTNTKGVPVKG